MILSSVSAVAHLRIAASCISIMAIMGASTQDYGGLPQVPKGLPVVAINTAGTSAEITISYVITDERAARLKWAMKLIKVSLALISDPELMVSKPAQVAAATGMDAFDSCC